jgi:low affinity Fe/Cu permease
MTAGSGLDHADMIVPNPFPSSACIAFGSLGVVKANVSSLQRMRRKRRAFGAPSATPQSSERIMKKISRIFGELANSVALASGKPPAFVAAVGVVLIWALSGPLFSYSDTWQLVINTGTTIITFLMVFLIQNSQNRDSAAIQVKLDELISTSSAKNIYVGIEHLTDEELDDLRRKCEERAIRPPNDSEVRD